ncbi:hypothetical protein HPB52_005708 [Rhipicephalus sanguineus]|uniref:GH18 domain-containing protein n=1 Tax=Rhipicephalus sanguineus TaxID=34632 RepID=A0A9D4SMG1_RHISA|nr:hypothetical protein HPB52_005708 [Rhipicephalus sanguineus]
MSQARFSLSDFDDSELPPWSTEFYDTDGFSPPSQPSTLRGAGKRSSWLRKLSTLASTPEDGSYLKTTTGKPRKAYWARSGSPNADRNGHNRRHSFGSRALANAVESSDDGVTITESASASLPRKETPRVPYVEKEDTGRAAFPRKTRRRSKYDVSGDNSEASRDHMRTPSTTTDVKYRSHGRSPRRLHQLASTPARRLRQSPPRKIAVFSKPRSLAPPPRIDDFSDIPPVEMILFDSPPLLLPSSRLEPPRDLVGRETTSSPEKTKTASYIPARHKSPPSDSPTPQVSEVMSVPEETEERQASPAEWVVAGRLTFEQIWVFCVVASATLLLPFVMVILSYLLTPIRDAREATAETSVTRGPASSFTLPTWPTLTTVDTWEGFPTACHRQRIISDDISQVMPRNSIRGADVTGLDLFCLYNTSRFVSSSFGSFLPDNLPFVACRYIVYWSFRLVDGSLMSRTPTFDIVYGLVNLKDMLKNAGAASVKVLLVVGGYVEDNPQFSLLARDANAMARFVKDAMRLVESHNIDGLAIHWLEAEPGCRLPGSLGDHETLHVIFAGLRGIFDLNSFQGILAVILPAGVDSSIVRSVIDIVDYVFLETHKTMPQPSPDYSSICRNVSNRMVSDLTSLPSYSANARKMCITLSVAPWIFEAQQQSNGYGQLPTLDALSSSGDHPGFASAQEMCSSSPCRLNPSLTGSCIAVRISTLGGYAYVLLLLNETTLQEVFTSYLPPHDVRCALLLDLELDNYAGQCNFTTSTKVNLTDYWLVERLVSSIDGSSSPIVRFLPLC